jgi:hypothetical protein
VRNPEFQLVAWTLKFFVQVETQAALGGKVSAGKPAQPPQRTADTPGKKR